MARGSHGVLLSLVLSFYRVQQCLTDSHSLLFQYTLNHGRPDLPEYSVLGILDGCEIYYFDSNMKITVPRQKWMAEAFDKTYWEQCTITNAGFHGIIKGQADEWLQKENQTSSTHYLQGLFGCELHDANPNEGILKFAFDGRYILSFDKDTLVWIIHDKFAKEFKEKWDKETKMNHYFKSLLENDCPDLWKTYYSIGNASLSRKTPPEVSIIAKSGSYSFLQCIVIGFYPQPINVTWLKNGKPAHETNSTGLLPNEDGTFQLKTTLQFDPYDGSQYACHIEHISFPGGKTVLWEGKVKNSKNVGLIVLGVLVSLAIILIIFIWWRRQRGYNVI
ncbi:class I histocompatibility antigen, F10 alpha chain-like isoform X1 [Stegostoma tigrinum]|uniref:class I histocompatibility antigen, F10 alpha chain-like isoform X1 n=1 Tax=Stegostoma tigrinum TaxID=3053191 RepID=UPI0028700228|nr:class I histocompatibility antigen, F10 alpha chain-like isoform X1 [Stegostoma tigrinum]